jgi:hypothetical protein
MRANGQNKARDSIETPQTARNVEEKRDCGVLATDQWVPPEKADLAKEAHVKIQRRSQIIDPRNADSNPFVELYADNTVVPTHNSMLFSLSPPP